jgi:hypothetical protein
MKRKLVLFGAALVLLGISLGQAANVPHIALAQSGGGYDLTWNVIAGGGGTSTSANGVYSLSGTIGQADAGPLSGAPYTLNGGFWNDALNGLKLFLPLIRR